MQGVGPWVCGDDQQAAKILFIKPIGYAITVLLMKKPALRIEPFW
jgi:hypothetical protein